MEIINYGKLAIAKNW